jgi:uncharacterized membrane protein
MLTMSVETDEETYAVDMRHHSVIVSNALICTTLLPQVVNCLIYVYQYEAFSHCMCSIIILATSCGNFV